MTEPITMTELPKEMISKKPKLKAPYSSCPDKKLLKPTFPSKRTIKGLDQNDTSEGMESTQFEPTRQLKRSILRPSKSMADKCPLKSSVKAAAKAPEISKWSSYMLDEDEDAYDDKFEPQERMRSLHDVVDIEEGFDCVWMDGPPTLNIGNGDLPADTAVGDFNSVQLQGSIFAGEREYGNEGDGNEDDDDDGEEESLMDGEEESSATTTTTAETKKKTKKGYNNNKTDRSRALISKGKEEVERRRSSMH